MFTNEDLLAIQKLIRTETTEIVQKETRKIILEETPKIVQGIIEKELKPIKKDIKHIKKTIDVMIDRFDRDDVKLQKHVTRIETHLGLPTQAL